MELSAIDKLAASADPAERRQAASLLADIGGDHALDRLEKLVQDRNEAVREVAQDTIIILGGHAAVKRIAPLVGSADAGIRNTAIEILRRIGEDGLDILHALAHSPDDRLRLFIVDVLGSIGNHDSLETLIECLFDENANVRNQTVISLGTIGNAKAFEHLKALINDEEWIRFSVIEALAKIAHPEVIDFLLSELKRWSNDEITMSAILETLSTIPSDKVIRPLMDMLPEATPYIRLAIVSTILKVIPSITTLTSTDIACLKAIIDERLRDADDDVLKLMLTALSTIGDRASIQKIIELARETDPDSRLDLWDDIQNTLSSIGDKQALLSLLDAEEEKLQILGARILGRIGGEEETRAINARILAAQGYVKRAYVEALCSIGSPESRDTFKALLHDKDGHVACYAIRAVGTMGNPDDIDDLKVFLAHPYDDLRDASLDAIAKIGSAKAQGAFLSLLHHADPQMRIMGLTGLARLNAPMLAESVLKLLDDSTVEVRLRSIQTAKDAGLPLSLEKLKALLNDESHDIRFVILDIIGQQRLAKLRSVLDDAIRSDDIWIAYHAIEALGQFHDDEAKARLLTILAGSQDFLRIAAVKTLGEWGDEALADELEIYIDDKNLDVARNVSQAIDKLKGLEF